MRISPKKSNLTRLSELAWNQRWPYHKVKCQPSISSDKYLDQESCKKLHTKTHEIFKSIEKLTHIILLIFEHVKISQKQSQHVEHIVIFLEFLWENLNAQVVQVARTGVNIATNQEYWKENQKA